MATLEKIRNRSTLVLGVIGFALFAFVLGDMINSGSSLFGSSQTEIGVVNGKAIQHQSYLAAEQELTGVYKRSRGQIDPYMAEQIKVQTWDGLVEKVLLGEQLEALGLNVTDKELFDMVQGKELDPVVKQLFTNPQTGQVDKAQILSYLQAVNSNQVDEANRDYWLFMEKDIKKRRSLTKYNNLISKGLYVTSVEAKADFNERQYLVDFNYVLKPYTAISDSAVTVSESEVKAYYNKHEKEFQQEANRDLEYVAFEVLPSAKDRQEAEKYITDLKPSFVKADDVARFVSLNSDSPFQDRFYKKGELAPAVDTLLFAAEVGFVYGPYEETGAFKLAKVVERAQLPDSAEARHILIPVNEQTSLEVAKAKVDSLKSAVQSGSSFAELAAQFGTDATKEKGGDLGWFGQNRMVKPFNDAVFAASKNDLLVIETQFGVHLVEVTGISAKSEMVKIAFVQRMIEASSQTYQDVYAQANKFAAESSNDSFDTAIQTAGLAKRIVPRIKEIDSRVTGLDNPRELVRWAFKEETKVGAFSQVFELGNKFVMARLVTVREAGVASLKDVTAEVTSRLKQDKKAEKLIAEMKGATSLDALGEVKTASNVTFASRQIPGAGVEPAVIGTAVGMAKDKLSQPIKGLNGVYVLQVTSVTNPNFENPAYQANQKSLESALQNRASYEAYNALKKKADIQDNRGRFL